MPPLEELVRSLSNPKRAATWAVAGIAGLGIVVGLGIASTTRSANGPGRQRPRRWPPVRARRAT